MARTPVASCLVRLSPHYRRDAFVLGLQRLGYRVTDKPWQPRGPGDILVTWNRHGWFNDVALQYEREGLKIIVAENGYLGKDATGHQLYALARTHHNGAGQWVEGTEDRWSSLGFELKPWREGGEHILLLPQRGIGAPGVAMPRPWLADVTRRLKAVTQRPIKVRPHPGAVRSQPYDDLKGAWAAVIWGSGAGLKSMIAGVPVFHDMPNWIGAPAATFGVENIENPKMGDRLPTFRRVAHAQWTVAEIASGEPFKRLLEA